MSDTARFDLKPEYFRLGRSLASLLTSEYQVASTKRIVIAIAGESGSGKSVTATCLARELDAAGIPAAVLHQDDYFHRPPRANHEHRVRDLDRVGPHEVNLDLLRARIADFRAGAAEVSAPLVDYSTDGFFTQRLDFSAVCTLIVEGTYVLRLDDADVRIFLEATSDETRERRRLRNRDIVAPVVDQVLAIEHELIAPQAALAHIVIGREFDIRRRAP